MKGYVYIMTTVNNSVLYTGVTSNLKARVFQHVNKKRPDSFSAKYNVNKLVYFEILDSIGEAIKREKQIKGGSRKKKVDLVNAFNPNWDDLIMVLDGR
jgi:putative endonuclease